MRDIKKPLRNLKSNPNDILIHKYKEEQKKISKELPSKVEIFETGKYEDKYVDEVEYKNGKPILKASNHFDIKKEIGKSLEDDGKMRNDFFKNRPKVKLHEENINTYKKNKHKQKRNWKILYILFGIIAIIFILAFTFIFNKADIIINPKNKDLDFSETFILDKKDLIIDMTEASSSKEITKSSPKNVNLKADGEVILYNNFSESPVSLIKNTRLQSKNGKIFKILDSVKIPGKKNGNPGSIKVKVLAENFGKEYNINSTDFSIPGFKNSAKYNSVYAKSVKDFSGGLTGIVYTVSENDISATNKELKFNLEKDISKNLKEKKYNDYYSLYNNLFYDYTDNKDTLLTSEQNSYTLNSIAYLISIKKDVLAKLIAERSLQENYNSNEKIDLQNIDQLSFTFEENIDLTKDDTFKVLISGKTKLIWWTDLEAIKKSLLGQKFSEFGNILKNYTSSVNASNFSKSPFWLLSFPNKINNINIKEIIK